jgi:phosphatidate cytidylyltransferase
MAFNWQTFKTRTLTAGVFVVVMLTGLLWNQWSFLLLFSVIHFGCWWEYTRLMEKIHNTFLHIYSKLGFILLGYGFMLWFCGAGYQIAGYNIKENVSLPVSFAGFILLTIGLFQKMRVDLKSISATALGVLYISLSGGLMVDLYSNTEFNDSMLRTNGNKTYALLIPLFVIGCMWINDTMAYIVGSLIGRTPFSKISPKKTWEGTIGGIILSSVIMGYLAFTIDKSFVLGQTFIWWTILAMIASVTGTLGDLLESRLKRMAEVKDSGQIMPGHGGFLDRFDSLLLAIPFVWLYVRFLIN